jgi:hypothetical protein
MGSGKAYAEVGEANKQLTKLTFKFCLKIQKRFSKFALTEIFSFDFFEKWYLK